MVLISVVIPTFRRPILLAEAIESVLAQTYRCWELIVADDDPQAGARPVVERYRAGEEGRIRYVHVGGGGVARARNAGIRLARGQAVAFLDDDDLFLAEKLRLQAELLDSHGDIGLVYGRMESVTPDGRVYNRYPKRLGSTHAQLVRGNFIPISTVVVRREVLEAAGLFDPHFSNCADYELWLRIARSTRLGAVDQVLTTYRRQPDSISRDTLLSRREKLHMFLRRDARERYGLGWRQRQARIAASYYQLAREQVRAGQFGQAAGAFGRALWWDVFVGFRVRPRRAGWAQKMTGLAKPVAAIPYCAWRGLAGLRWNAAHKRASV